MLLWDINTVYEDKHTRIRPDRMDTPEKGDFPQKENSAPLSTPLRSSHRYIYSSTYIYASVRAIIAIRDKVPRVIIYSGKHLGKKYRLRLLSTDLTLIYTPLSTGITAYYDPNGRSNFFTVTCLEIFAAFSTSSHTATSSNDEFLSLLFSFLVTLL